MKKGVSIPTARQLPSGSWYCRLRINGRDISITKPTEKEAIAEAMAVKHGVKEAEKKASKKKTLKEAVTEYIDRRKGLISPSTIYGYESYKSQCFQKMMSANIYTTTDKQWQAAIKLEAMGKSPKYIKNAWMLMSAAIYEATRHRVDVTLPAQEVNERPYLDPDQVKVFVKAIKGESIEIPALLELSSLRRSEMLALTWDKVDMENRIIYVHGARVSGDKGQLVHKKQNKNATSRRTVPIIPPLLEALQSSEQNGTYVVNLTGGWICTRINEICRENGLPEVGNHGLRHSFASLAHSMGMKEKTAMKIGGWADSGTMRKIYTHISEKEIAKEAQGFSNFFSDDTEKSGDENGDEE